MRRFTAFSVTSLVKVEEEVKPKKPENKRQKPDAMKPLDQG